MPPKAQGGPKAAPLPPNDWRFSCEGAERLCAKRPRQLQALVRWRAVIQGNHLGTESRVWTGKKLATS
jgi:hypothetical protein